MLVVMCVTSLSACKNTINSVDESLVFRVENVSKRGNVVLDTSLADLKEKNIEIADLIEVSFGENTYVMPFAKTYSDVDVGNMMMRYDADDDEVCLVINGGDFATSTGFADKKEISEDPGYSWDMAYDSLTIGLKEKQGYRDEYETRNLERSNDRSDYATLDDKQYANYREVKVSGIREKILYRGSSPLDEDLKRNEYIMTFIEEDGIKSIINTTDSVSQMMEYASYKESYYSDCNVVNVEMSYDYNSDVFKEKFKNVILFINENEGPYFVHCKEGKDRTGIVCIIIELFMGTPYDEVVDDYMQTYINYYGLEKGTTKYDMTIKNTITKVLEIAFETDDLNGISLNDKAKEYLLSTGLSEEDLNCLKEKIG